MKVEILYTPSCPKCKRELSALRTAAASISPAVDWKEIDIAHAIDYAVELGVMKPPAVAIDGRLAFTALPSARALAKAIRLRLETSYGH